MHQSFDKKVDWTVWTEHRHLPEVRAPKRDFFKIEILKPDSFLKLFFSFYTSTSFYSYTAAYRSIRHR